MLFNSYVFWVFFATVFVLYRLSKHHAQNRILLAASYVFYAWWDVRYLSLILIATVVNYLVGIGISQTESPRRKKALLTLALVVSLGLLAAFKYYGFFSRELAALLSQLHIPVSLPALEVLLPVGISFYTFQTLSYTIDVYRGKTPVTRRLFDFALYVSFFPQLVAGPIERSSNLMPQILNPRRPRPDDFAEGLYLVLTGLFTKIVVADNMAAIVNTVFAKDAHQLSGFEVLIGVYAFAFQIYGDFAGYSSIARGVAKWLGFDLMVNFRMPYLATNPREFWSRWHISLSTWLRDYLYIPLGGNRRGKGKTYRNLVITMLLGGLWHGANWTFIAWGAFHGLILCVGRMFERPKAAPRPKARPWARVLAILIMFHLVCVGWLLFRADSITQVWIMVERVVNDFRITEFGLFSLGMIVFYCAPLVLYECWIEWKGKLLWLTHTHWAARGAAYSYLALMMWFFMPRVQHAFFYFQF